MVYEDYTIYVEDDGAGRWTVAPNSITVTGQQRQDDDDKITKDFGASHFGDFEHYLTLVVSARSGADYGYVMGGIWGVSNALNDIAGLESAEEEGLVLEVRDNKTAGKYWCSITGTYPIVTRDLILNVGTTYYLTISRVNTTVTFKAYTDAARTNLVGSTSFTGVNTPFRYMYAAVSAGFTGTNAWTGTISNLDLQEVPVGWTGKISGVTNPAKVMGVAVANIVKVKGVA